MDSYEVLGVARDATDEAINKAYRGLARKLHPDKNKDDPKAAERFDAVKRARDVLLDAAERAALDGTLKQREYARQRDEKLSSERRAMKEALREKERSAAAARDAHAYREAAAKAKLELARSAHAAPGICLRCLRIRLCPSTIWRPARASASLHARRSPCRTP